MPSRRWILILWAVLAGCGDEPPSEVPPDEVPPDPEPVGCVAGELTLEDGSCLPAGVVPEACAAGFEATGDGGCRAILPAAPCPPGQIAVPGDLACRDLADCGDGPWGLIPIEADTEHVDASFAGTSDGSAAAPWTTIGEAIAAASSGAIVAVAEGTYAEDLSLASPLRLWGRCPQLVTIQGSANGAGTVSASSGAAGAEIRGLTLAGRHGLNITGTDPLLVDAVHVSGVTQRGAMFRSGANATLRNTLIEGTTQVGILALGSRITLEASEVRGNRAQGAAAHASAIALQYDPIGGRAALTMTGSMMSDNEVEGLFVLGADARVEASVVRDTLANGDVGDIRAIGVLRDPSSGEVGVAEVVGSVVERSAEHGLFVQGGALTVEQSVVRDSVPGQTFERGRGIAAQNDPFTLAPSNLVVRSCQVANNHEIGVFAGASVAEITSLLVTGTLPLEADHAAGIVAQDDMSGARAAATIVASAVDNHAGLGILVAGSDGFVDRTAVRAILPDGVQLNGRGIAVQDSPDTGNRGALTVRATQIEQTLDLGLVVAGSDAIVEDTAVVATSGRALDGLFGDGVAVVAVDGIPTSAQLLRLSVAASARAAVSSFGAAVSLADSVLDCNTLDLAAEEHLGLSPSLEDAGGNRCGCAEDEVACKVVSSMLAPPEAVADP